jgi:hypothetical protein
MSDAMPCHGMVRFGSNGDDAGYHSLSLALGKVQRGQRGTSDDLGSIGEALVQQIL